MMTMIEVDLVLHVEVDSLITELVQEMTFEGTLPIVSKVVASSIITPTSRVGGTQEILHMISSYAIVNTKFSSW